MDTATVKTRLIISDTHGMNFNHMPFQLADIAIHCGDITDGSKLNEFRTTINILKDIDAPLKFAIAGNHDFTLDDFAFERKVAETVPPLDPELVVKEYGTIGEAKQIFDDAKNSLYPGLRGWRFQDHPERGHNFSIEKGADIVKTRGPPRGIMNYTHGLERAGCANLFAAVAHAKPQIHCFGHIHEGWGAKLITWRDTYGEQPTHFTAIDNNSSHAIETLASLEPSKFDTEEELAQKSKRLEGYQLARCCQMIECPVNNEQTLFVNASIQGSDDLLTQIPWLVDIELPRAVR